MSKSTDQITVAALHRFMSDAPAPGQGFARLHEIQRLREDIQAAQSALDTAVVQARSEGYSWAVVAAGLGVSPQGARQRYLRLTS